MYFDNDKKQFNIKRFRVETQTLKNKFLFIKEGNKNYLKFVTVHPNPTLLVFTGKKKADAASTEWKPAEQVEITGWKTIGIKLCDNDLIQIEDSYPPVAEESAQEEEHHDEGEANVAPTLF
ncbi:DNA topoisomerase IV subunit A [compost metagenome]